MELYAGEVIQQFGGLWTDRLDAPQGMRRRPANLLPEYRFSMLKRTFLPKKGDAPIWAAEPAISDRKEMKLYAFGFSASEYSGVFENEGKKPRTSCRRRRRSRPTLLEKIAGYPPVGR